MVAEENGRIIGYLWLQTCAAPASVAQSGCRSTRIYIRSLYVSPDRKGIGVGSALMNLAVEHARSSGFAEIWLGVMKPNRRAYDWYMERGFFVRGEEAFPMGGTTVSCLICSKTLSGRFVAVYDDSSALSLNELCRCLFSQQVANWRPLRDAVGKRRLIETKTFREKGLLLRVQWNPGRMASSTADVERAVDRRSCFLCRRRLSRSQKAIQYRKDFLILCNPAPIALPHFTVAARAHIPQAFFPAAEDYLLLCRDFGPRWNVLYNGPRCGASAPDHLHFQVIPSGVLPLSAGVGITAIGSDRGVSVSVFRRLGFGAIVLKGRQASPLAGILGRLQAVLPSAAGDASDGEPMFNVLGRYDGKFWQLMIYPRRRHRPKDFHRLDEKRLVISPGVFEMGGLAVTPDENTFRCIDKFRLLRVLREVACPPGRVANIAGRLLLKGGGH